ncbi:PREDICTED: uncharacterized protein LOC105966667 [Erythranthe guttata]|uniref:uncharacterized protein LOC105966667 n=1 Tax=Erythranthe guttata TaxID=4155 RepID=UPI00064D9DBB|nr:PREDICTED: uncharacterized protein LOC105966667 [Erythranthe guttata]|eukprot:XP_012846711.1 PREDICTED: uncharacterized protein LOC105966667 [Erythranthe guttata]
MTKNIEDNEDILLSNSGLRLKTPGFTILGKSKSQLELKSERIRRVTLGVNFREEGWKRERSKSEPPEKNSSSRVPNAGELEEGAAAAVAVVVVVMGVGEELWFWVGGWMGWGAGKMNTG